jgi:hypothetical protein
LKIEEKRVGKETKEEDAIKELHGLQKRKKKKVKSISQPGQWLKKEEKKKSKLPLGAKKRSSWVEGVKKGKEENKRKWVIDQVKAH